MRGRIVAATHRSRPAGRRGIEQQAIRRPGGVCERAHEAFPVLRARQELEPARNRVGLGWRGQHRLGVRGEAFSDVEGALAFDFVGISRVTSLSEGQRVANGLGTQLS